MALGLDLVREQIRLAAGEPLSMRQEDVHPRGASIEFRIYAEDPEGGFLPQAGTVRRLTLPQGPGVRCDVGVRQGGAVPFHYDPLIGKIIVWGDTREHALARAARALAECALSGIPNTLPFHRWLLEQQAFRSGNYDTAFVTQEFKGKGPGGSAEDPEDAAILAALFLHASSRGARFSEPAKAGRNGDAERSRWRTAHPSLRAPLRPR